MKISIALAASLLLLVPSTHAVAATKAKAAPVAHDWLKTVNRTRDGAIVVGNPAAKVKIIEYLSMTCPHCAHLSGEMLPPLQRDYIAKGSVSLEVRHAVRDGYDFAASLLLRCEPPTAYLSSLEALFAGQEDWMTKGAAAKQTPDFDNKSTDEKLALVSRAAGFDSFFAKRGVSAKAYAACMGNEAAKKQLTQMAANSWERDAIPGTPLLLVNGQKQEGIHGWADLKPKIDAALK